MTESDPGKKLRALYLSLIMIMAVVTPFVAFTGAVSAAGNVDFQPKELGVDDVNVKVIPGQNVTVSVNVTNMGSAQGTQNVTVSINNTQIGSQSLTLNAGQSKNVTLNVTVPDGLSPGTYNLTVSTVDGTTTKEITVIPVGDANGDLSVNAGDAVVILRHSAGQSVAIDLAAADANDDTSVNAGDAVVVLRFSAGQINELPPPT